MQAILFALVAHIGWGTGDIFGAMASRKIGGYSMTFWSYLLRIPLLAFFLFFDIEHIRALTLNNILICSLLAVVGIMGTAFFFEAFQGSNPSLVGTIGAAFVVPTVLLSILVFGEKLTLFQTLTIAIIVIGLVVTTLDFGSLRRGAAILDRGAILALLAMLCWGVYFALIRIPIEEIGWFLPGYITCFFAPLVLVMIRMKGIKLTAPTAHQSFPVFFAAVLLSTAANFGYNLGISSGYTSIVAPIAGAYPILFVSLAALVFKESLRKQQIIGIVISLVGIVLLSVLP